MQTQTCHGTDYAAVRSGQHPPGRDQGSNSSFTLRRNIVLLGAPYPGALGNWTDVFATTISTGLVNMTFASNLYWSTSLSDPASQLRFGPSQGTESFAAWRAAGSAGAVDARHLALLDLCVRHHAARAHVVGGHRAAEFRWARRARGAAGARLFV